MTDCFCAFDQTLSPLRKPARATCTCNAPQVSARISPTMPTNAYARGINRLDNGRCKVIVEVRIASLVSRLARHVQARHCSGLSIRLLLRSMPQEHDAVR